MDAGAGHGTCGRRACRQDEAAAAGLAADVDADEPDEPEPDEPEPDEPEPDAAGVEDDVEGVEDVDDAESVDDVVSDEEPARESVR